MSDNRTKVAISDKISGTLPLPPLGYTSIYLLKIQGFLLHWVESVFVPKRTQIEIVGKSSGQPPKNTHGTTDAAQKNTQVFSSEKTIHRYRTGKHKFAISFGS